LSATTKTITMNYRVFHHCENHEPEQHTSVTGLLHALLLTHNGVSSFPVIARSIATKQSRKGCLLNKK
ncbi:MAG: hypothetical protein LBJ43_00450, partial [Propionibacteriaceae bacterium]|nr:hypothetical protein [Propionibacteriaceae bacterium]